MSDMSWADRLRALYRGNNFLSPSSYNELADHLDALTSELHTLKNSEAAAIVHAEARLSIAESELMSARAELERLRATGSR